MLFKVMFFTLIAGSCECEGDKPYTAFIRRTGSTTYGDVCTTVGSRTGAPFCFVEDNSPCPDKQRDGGSSRLNFAMGSNWYYSYDACSDWKN